MADIVQIYQWHSKV